MATEDRPQRDRQRVLRPIARLWWQNEDTAGLPSLVDRRSFNDLLKDVEPRGKSTCGIAPVDPVAPGFKVEWSPPSRWSKTRSPSSGGPTASSGSSRWGIIRWASTARANPAASSGSWKTRMATAGTTRQTTFLDGLGFPTGLMPWRKGVLVACAPDIFYAEDRDGDGKAEHREVLFTGFVEGNQQHRLNGFELGLDGWVYGANGDSGGHGPVAEDR